MKYFVHRAEDLEFDADAGGELRGSFAALSAGVTHFELGGPATGELVVLVPGLTVPLLYWDGVARELHDRGFRTLSYSAYGRGYSERSRSEYDEAMFVRQLDDLLSYVNIGGRPHLVGTSMGALIAMAYAADRPEAVSSLSLIGPAGMSTKAALQQKALSVDMLAKLVAQRFGRKILLGHLGHNVLDPALVEPLTKMVVDCFRYEGSMYAFFSTLQNYPLTGRTELFRRIGQTATPTLLAWGSEDAVTPVSGFGQASALLRPAMAEVIGDCGHMAPYERPARTAELLATFIDNERERTTS
ncbi:alpha/beta hydrolase [Rhodococcus sp. BGS-1C]|uniref:alpha/beta fold hydrolase n=1 Tax=unclassified Rhodococcus (in: high G+C Gram-positive bacteria) TaxID=192944 RepID=UPI0019D22176|nr:alpha/beta hydrolase [Rhodococcus sp. KRD197]